MELQIFHTDTANNAPIASRRRRLDEENQAANLTQELAAHIIKLVMLAVEPVCVQVDHLKEAAREKFQREHIPQTADHLMFGTSAADQRLELHALGELRAPEKILVAIRHCA